MGGPVDRVVDLRRCVLANDDWSYDSGVALIGREATASLEASGSQLIVLRQSDGELVVRGSKEQVDAAARLIEQLRQG